MKRRLTESDDLESSLRGTQFEDVARVELEILSISVAVDFGSFDVEDLES